MARPSVPALHPVITGAWDCRTAASSPALADADSATTTAPGSAEQPQVAP